MNLPNVVSVVGDVINSFSNGFGLGVDTEGGCSVGGTIELSSPPAVETEYSSLPDLNIRLTGSLTISSWLSSFSPLNLPNIAEVTGDVVIVAQNNFVSFSLSGLASIGGLL